MKKIILLSLAIFPAYDLLAQNIGIGTTNPHPNAILEISGINKGLLLPRGDVATRTILNSNTAKGLLMFDTTTNTVWIHNGNGLSSGWGSLSNGNNYWALSGSLGTEIKNTGNGAIWSENPTAVFFDPGVIQPPKSGAGTRMMWLPHKSAFRVGTVTGSQWNAENIGVWSFAAGVGITASGETSTAFGSNTIASGGASTAMGRETTASGNYSTAIGFNTKASGNTSTAMGESTTATGINSTAMGGFTKALEIYSTSLGLNAKATGIASLSTGVQTNARSYASMTLGRYNDSIVTSSTTTWIASDPILYVGNGASDAERSNALVVYKNGDTEISGYTQLGKTSEAAPSIKMKKLTGTSSSTQNTWVNIPHGLAQNKIIAVNIIMYGTGGVNYPPSYTFQTGLQYDYQVTSTFIVVINSNGNSGNILSKPFTILITYEE